MSKVAGDWADKGIWSVGHGYTVIPGVVQDSKKAIPSYIT